MASLTYFTVTGTYLASLKDSVYDVDNDPDLTPLSGVVTFTPLINTGDTITATTLTPPSNLLLVPIKATIRTGQIVTNGVTGIRLPANTAVLGLTGGLYYRVDFYEGLTGGGKTYQVRSFSFLAPTSDVTIDLVEVTPVPGQPATGPLPSSAVLSVAGRTGNIVLTPNDLSGASTIGKNLIAAADQAAVQAIVGIPTSVMEYKGVWNASANSPTLADGAGNAGDLYRVGTAGSRNLGSGSITFSVGDDVVYNGATWEKLGQVVDKASVGLGSVDNTSDAAKPVSTAQQAALDLKAPLVAGTFPWPQGLVALWDFVHDTVGGSTVTSTVGSQTVALTALASKTVVKDAADPGPFGPSLVLDGATAFVKAGNLGALDVSQSGDQVTVVTWVKDTANNHDDGGGNGLAFRAGSHNDGSTPSRQYGSYFDADSPTWSKGKYTPHIGAQDGVAAGYIYSCDNAATARKLNTGTGQGQWHMEAFTFDGTQLAAFIDGLLDSNTACPEPAISGQTAPERIVDRNPYPLRKGINRSQTTKRFSIGGSSHWNGTTDTGLSFTTGKLGGVAVFNRALSANEIMQIRLATLLSGEPITMYSFEMSSTGNHALREIGWTGRGGAVNADVSGLNTGPEYAVIRPAGGTKAYLTKTSTTIGAAYGPVSGLNSAQVVRARWKMLSAATTSAAQRLLVKVGSQWWASNTTYATSGAHAPDTNWSGAETQTHTCDWNAGNWRAVTMTPTGGTATYQNLVKNPALTSVATDWFKSSGAAHATATGRVSDGAGGFVYRITWTGTDNGSVNLGGKAQAGVAALTAGTVYSASIVAKPSKVQELRLQIIWYDSGNAQISTSDGAVVTVGNTPTTLVCAGTAPAGAVSAALMVQSVFPPGISWLSGDTLDLSNALLVSGPLLPAYFDGATAGAAWDGSAWGSSSTYTNMPTGVLSLSGSTNAAYIDNALITAVGFLSSGGDGTAVRVSDLELLPS